MSITLEKNSKGFFRKQKKNNLMKEKAEEEQIALKLNVIEIEKDANIRKV